MKVGFLVLGLFMLVGNLSHGADYYKCRDALGHISFSPMPCAAPVIGDDRYQGVWDDMQDLVAKGQNAVESLAGTSYSIMQCEAELVQVKQEASSLKSRLVNMPNESKNLRSAYYHLEDCLVCRVSAKMSCEESRKYLNEALNDLTVHSKD